MPDNRPTWFGGDEPPLADLLADPVTHLVMRGDGVRMEDLVALIERLTGRRPYDILQSGSCGQA